MTKFRIIKDNCLRALDNLPDSSVHCIVTSPPYFPKIRDYNIESSKWEDGWSGCLGNEDNPNNYISHMLEITNKIKRVLRPDGSFWLNIGDAYAKNNKWEDIGIKKKDLIGIPWMLSFAIRKSGWYLRQDNIWKKTDAFPESVKDRTTRSHEYMFHFTKTDNYFFDTFAIREETHNKRTVWDLATANYKGSHLAVFPEKLAEVAILASTSNKGVCENCGAQYERKVSKKRERTRPAKNNKKDQTGKSRRDPGRHITKFDSVGWFQTCKCESCKCQPATVLDVFSGSGTTGVASLKNNRYYLGIELNDKNVIMSRKRLRDVDPIFVKEDKNLLR